MNHLFLRDSVIEVHQEVQRPLNSVEARIQQTASRGIKGVMNVSSEDIVRRTLSHIVAFFKQPDISRNLSSEVIQRLDAINFAEVYPRVRDYLLNHKLADMRSTVHGFAATLPEYPLVKSELDQTLYLHEPFWNQVYQNLILAQAAL